MNLFERQAETSSPLADRMRPNQLEDVVGQAHLLGHQVKDWLMAELPEIRDIIVHLEPEGRQ